MNDKEEKDTVKLLGQGGQKSLCHGKGDVNSQD